MAFIIFVGDDEEIVCNDGADVCLSLIGLYNPRYEIPHSIEEIFERRGDYSDICEAGE